MKNKTPPIFLEIPPEKARELFETILNVNLTGASMKTHRPGHKEPDRLSIQGLPRSVLSDQDFWLRLSYLGAVADSKIGIEGREVPMVDVWKESLTGTSPKKLIGAFVGIEPTGYHEWKVRQEES